MAKRKIVKNENVEPIKEIEKVEIPNVNEDTVIDQEEIIETPKLEVEEIVPEKIENDVEIVKEETLMEKKQKRNKNTIMFGYVWNGQEYD